MLTHPSKRKRTYAYYGKRTGIGWQPLRRYPCHDRTRSGAPLARSMYRLQCGGEYTEGK
jgi:hypothetical protein